MKTLYLLIPFAPLVGALIAGLLGWLIGPKATHRATILGMLVSLTAACLVLHLRWRPPLRGPPPLAHTA